jgi:hypothetical protein
MWVCAVANAVSNHLGAPLQQGKTCKGEENVFYFFLNGECIENMAHQLVLIHQYLF